MSDNLPYDEKELLTRIADGDEKAFEKLYRSYARELIPFFVRLTSNESAANDLLQNTFLAVWLDRTKLKEINNINAYLYKIAANRAYTWLAKIKSTQRLESVASAYIPESEEITSHEVLFREAKRIVEETINAMPSQRRAIFQMHREYGLKYNEIADKLGISASTARNSVAAALETIRQKLAKMGLAIFFALFFALQ